MNLNKSKIIPTTFSYVSILVHWDFDKIFYFCLMYQLFLNELCFLFTLKKDETLIKPQICTHKLARCTSSFSKSKQKATNLLRNEEDKNI